MISFRIVPHTRRPDTDVVEILVDGAVVGLIYPNDEKQIKIVSAHLQGAGDKRGIAPHIVVNDNVGTPAPIPEVVMTFDPRRYAFAGGVLIREKD